jgi:hypothetical protein
MNFERGKSPQVAMGIGRNIYIQDLHDEFMKEVKRSFSSLVSSDTYLYKIEEDGYMEFGLDYYSENGMNVLEKKIRSLIYRKYRKKLMIVDDKYWEKFYTEDNMPEESPFYNEESIFVKFL